MRTHSGKDDLSPIQQVMRLFKAGLYVGILGGFLLWTFYNWQDKPESDPPMYGFFATMFAYVVIAIVGMILGYFDNNSQRLHEEKLFEKYEDFMKSFYQLKWVSNQLDILRTGQEDMVDLSTYLISQANVKDIHIHKSIAKTLRNMRRKYSEQIEDIRLDYDEFSKKWLNESEMEDIMEFDEFQEIKNRLSVKLNEKEELMV